MHHQLKKNASNTSTRTVARAATTPCAQRWWEWGAKEQAGVCGPMMIMAVRYVGWRWGHAAGGRCSLSWLVGWLGAGAGRAFLEHAQSAAAFLLSGTDFKTAAPSLEV